MYITYCTKYLGCDPGVHNFIYEVTIIDSNFFDKVEVCAPTFHLAVVRSIIKIYSEKNINVEKNIFLYMYEVSKKINFPIKNQMKDYSALIPEFNEYIQKLNKYIAFI